MPDPNEDAAVQRTNGDTDDDSAPDAEVKLPSGAVMRRYDDEGYATIASNESTKVMVVPIGPADADAVVDALDSWTDRWE